MMHASSLKSIVLLATCVPAIFAAAPVKPYSCTNNRNICQNICYYTGCAHPYTGTNRDPTLLTRSKRDLHGPLIRQRRVDCGATHTPAPFKTKANGGLGIPSFGTSPDEYPFAGSTQGGLTPYGDGAGLLGVDPAEQQSQSGKVTKFWEQSPTTGDGQDAYLMLQDTAGIPYCDNNATTAAPFCDGSAFMGVHFLKADNVYCQWEIETANAKCYDGQTGNVVPRPAKARRDVSGDENGIPLAYWGMLHVQYPDMAAAMWNEEVHGPMPEGYEPITSVEQWLAMNRTAHIMPPKAAGERRSFFG